MKVLVGLLAGAIVLGAMASSPAQATVVRGFSLSGMTTSAQSIVRGTVVDQEVVYDSRWGRVYTHSIVEVSQVLWGTEQPGEIVVLRQIGGLLDGVQSSVVGTARVELGDEVVLFARTDGSLHYLVGMAQGMYRVQRSGSPTPVVTRGAGAQSLSLLPRIGPMRAVAPHRLTLARLVDQVEATLVAEGRVR